MLPEEVKQHEAISTLVEMLPEGVKQHVPPLSKKPDGSSKGQDAALLEQKHVAVTVNRACEGRWVPTYMRRQLVDNGHTALPAAPNAHEHALDRRPPPLAVTLEAMINELAENAHVLVDYITTVVPHLASQWQWCTENAATAIHEHSVLLGEQLCEEFTPISMDEMGPLPDESVAGLGPMCSMVGRTLPGMSFEEVLSTCKSLVTPRAPPEFQRIVKSREILKDAVDEANSSKCWVFSTVVNPDILPTSFLPHLCAGPCLCRERWYIEPREGKASVEVSNEAAGTSVCVTLRIYITRCGEKDCEVDSRLFTRPRHLGSVLPLGLLERLLEAHHLHSENLRDIIISLVHKNSTMASSHTHAGRALGALELSDGI